jgi:DNA repair ATPase RecN
MIQDKTTVQIKKISERYEQLKNAYMFQLDEMSHKDIEIKTLSANLRALLKKTTTLKKYEKTISDLKYELMDASIEHKKLNTARENLSLANAKIANLKRRNKLLTASPSLHLLRIKWVLVFVAAILMVKYRLMYNKT